VKCEVRPSKKRTFNFEISRVGAERSITKGDLSEDCLPLAILQIIPAVNQLLARHGFDFFTIIYGLPFLSFRKEESEHFWVVEVARWYLRIESDSAHREHGQVTFQGDRISFVFTDRREGVAYELVELRREEKGV